MLNPAARLGPRMLRMRFVVVLCVLAMSFGMIPATVRQAAAATPLIYDVLDFGARGNGVADDTDAIIAATRAARTSESGYGTIYLPAGTYMVRSMSLDAYKGINVYAKSTFIGDGRELTKLKVIASSITVATPNSAVILAHTESRVANLTVDGNRSQVNGTPLGDTRTQLIRTQNKANDVLFEGLRVTEGYGKNVESFALSINQSSGTTVRDVEAINNDGSGISISGDYYGVWSNNVTISKVLVHHNGWTGITFYGAESSSATGITAYSNITGINVEWSKNLTIRDSLAYDNIDAGIGGHGVSEGILFERVESRGFVSDTSPGDTVHFTWGYWRTPHPTTGIVEAGILQSAVFKDCVFTPNAGQPQIKINPDEPNTNFGEVVPHTMIVSGAGTDAWWFVYVPRGMVSRIDVEDYSLATFGVALETQATTVPGNIRPIARAGADIVVDDVSGDGSEAVHLDASASSDPDGTIADFEWFRNGVSLGRGAQITLWLAVGTYTVTLRVTDNHGATHTDQIVITVRDVVAPVTQSFATPFAPDDTWTNDATTITLFAKDSIGSVNVREIVYSTSGALTTPQTIAPGSRVEFVVAASGETVITFWAIDKAGNVEAPQTRSLKIDQVAPSLLRPTWTIEPTAYVSATTIPIRFDWSATDAASGVARYSAMFKAGGTTSALPLGSAMAETISPNVNHTGAYKLSVNARDTAGNTTAYRSTPLLKVKSFSETSANITYAGSWKTVAAPGTIGGSKTTASTKGATATFKFLGEQVVWVASYATNRGLAEVWVDGRKVATVDLYGPSAVRKIAYVSRKLKPGVVHKLEIRVLGTKQTASSGTTVDLDGFIVVDQQ